MRHLRLGGTKNYNLLFALLECCYWASNAALYAFTITILTAYGYSSVLCGVATTGIAVTSVAAQFGLGYITDTHIPSKRVLMVLLVVGGGLTLLLPRALLLPPALAIVCIVGVSLLDYSLYTTIDVWAVRSQQIHREIDFAVVRSGGSVGYALVALVLGTAVARLGVDILFYAHAALAVVAVLVCLTLEELPCANRRVAKAKAKALQQAEEGGDSLSMGQILSQLLHNRRYVVLVGATICMQFSFRITVTYLPLLVTNAGGDSGHFGIALFCSSMLEVAAMLLASRLLIHGVPPSYILIGAFACGAVRMFTLHLDQSPWLLIGFQVFQAGAMGGYLRVYTEYIHRITPPEITATATSVGSAMAMGVGGMLGNLLGGIIIEHMGIHVYMTISGLGFVAAGLCFLPAFLEGRRQVQGLRLRALLNAAHHPREE